MKFHLSFIWYFFGILILSESLNITHTEDQGETILKYFRQPVNKTLYQGDNLLLRCKPILNLNSLKGKIRHKWFKNGDKISESNNITIYKDGSLRIDSVTKSDTGSYKCIARYRHFAFESRDGFVNVLTENEDQQVSQGPTFSSWPEDTSAALNEDVIFECQALQHQKYSYQWFKNGSPLEFDSRIQLVQGNNLRVSSVQDQDSATYKCRICTFNSNEDCQEKSAILSVLIPPYFVNLPVDINSTLGSDVAFKCNASGVPLPTIQWFKNGEPVFPSKYFQYDGCNLKIIGLIGQDEGYYQCVAYNKFGTVDVTARLFVQNKKLVEESHEEIDELPLAKKATNTETFIETSTDPVIVHLSAPISLQLKEAKQNSLSISWQEPSIIKQVTNAPLNKLHKSLQYRIVWRVKTSNNQNELITSDTGTVIDGLTKETTYLIQVCAILGANKGPYSFLEASTISEPKYPGPPIDFKAEFVDFKYQQTMSPTLKFKWKRPVTNGEDVFKYRLYYEHLNYGPASANNENQYDAFLNSNANNDYYVDDYSSEDLREEKEKFLDIDTPSSKYDQRNSYEFLLEDLKKYSTYKFRLVAMNELMISQPVEKAVDGGAELMIETPSDVPDGPPENLKAETINTTALFVRWNRPSTEKCNGLIIGYKLAIKENDKQVWNSQEASEPRSKLINNMLPNQKYSIRVTAMTVNGSGPASDWVVAETFAYEMDENKVPDQPLELVAEPTDKTIVIHWKPPKDSNKTLIRKYLLSYGVNYPSNMIEIPGNQNSYIIKNLEPFSTYIISLKAKNNAGLGKEILKDVVTKRKSVLDENENLFPPLNVQAVAISPQSIEVRWTDWHLKQDEPIPDDRLYTVQYSTSEMSSDEYLYKNSTVRNVIISNLKPNTLYDFSVRLVIGTRYSDWSMTSSQMTMEASPAPRDVGIKSDPNEPSNVIISWKAPNYSLISGYVISFLDVKSYSRQKANPDSRIKWKHNYVTANEDQLNLQATVRKLRTDTEYYFKVQARNNHEYGGSSPTIIYKTPNSNGVGGGIVYKDKFISKSNETVPLDNSEIISSSIQPITVGFIQNSFLLLIGAVGCSLLILILIILIILCCKRNKKSEKNQSYTGPNCAKRNYSINDNTANQSIHGHNQQQHLLINNMSNNNNGNNNSYAQDLMPHPLSGNMNNFSISSTTSTLLKHHQHNMKTPHHQQMTGLQINNPNHMMLMMNPLSVSNSITTSTNMNAPPSTNNTQLSNTNTSSNDVEFYSNMTNQPAIPNDPSYTTESCFQFNTSYNNNNKLYQQQQTPMYPNAILRTSSLNDDNLSQQNDLDRDLTSASEALSAANAPFSINNTNMNSVSMSNTNDNIFMRNATRQKQVGMPFSAISSTASPNSFSNPISNGTESLFGSANNRKSFKNLPMATANLIQSNNQPNTSPNHPLAFNFNDLAATKQQTQKLQYNARQYMIENQQLHSNGEFPNHSPASSCHSSQQSQVYDRVPNSSNTSNNKSLLQPLKSFGAPSSFTHYPNSQQMPQSSFSIPNTPAKFCENLINNNNFMLSQSPAKKHLLVSMGEQQSTNTTIARGNNNNINNNNKPSDVLLMMGKSFENLYDRKLSTSSMNYNGEFTTEMANLEGIMKDLNAITAQQFDC